MTLGHELAHLLLHKRPSTATENEANRFSTNLLFPQIEFEANMIDRLQLRTSSRSSRHGASLSQALVYRAHDLDYIDDRRYRQLQIQMSKWRRNEPAYFAPVHGELMNRLVETNGGVDSVSRDLGVNRKHLQALTNWSHLRVA
ncbi:MAG: ImmA/IrrE family metallo-endopeptidase [Nocardioidaceae bacterium]